MIAISRQRDGSFVLSRIRENKSNIVPLSFGDCWTRTSGSLPLRGCFRTFPARYIKNGIKAQRSGFDPERRSSEGNELLSLRESERSAACDDDARNAPSAQVGHWFERTTCDQQKTPSKDGVFCWWRLLDSNQ